MRARGALILCARPKTVVIGKMTGKAATELVTKTDVRKISVVRWLAGKEGFHGPLS